MTVNKELKDDRSAEITYDYLDEDGALLFQIVKVSNGELRSRRPDGNGRYVWNLNGVKRVLYKLLDLLQREHETVYIVAGENNADRLSQEGLLATTNPFGPGKWLKKFGENLRHRDIVIIPDNDEESTRHADQISESVLKLAKSVKVVQLPDNPNGGDISDWLDSGNTIDRLVALVQKAHDLVIDTEGDDPKLTQLIDMIEDSGIEALRDPRKVAYVALPREDGNRIIPVQSKEFDIWVQRIAWTRMRWPLSDTSIKSAARIMECKALFDGDEYDLKIRAAKHEGSYWIDIDGSKGIWLNADGWDIYENPRIFKYLPHQGPLYTPVRNGTHKLIEKYMTRIKGDDDRILFICWLHACFIADIEIPMLSLWGESKAGKSTLQKVIRRLVDPCHPEFQDKNIAVQDIPIIASQHRMLCFDNPRNLSDNQSDFLCGAVTGDGSEKRMHYKDESILGREYQNIITISSVPCIVTEPDLVNRSLIIEMEQVDNEDKRGKLELWAEFVKDASMILGGIFDNLAKALTIVAGMQVPKVSRFDEFTEIAAAVAEVIGCGAENFITCYRKKVQGQSQDLAESAPVVIAVVAYHKEYSDFEMSPTEFWKGLNKHAKK